MLTYQSIVGSWAKSKSNVNLEKAFEKIQLPLMIKILNKQEGNNFNRIKVIYEKPHIFNGERLKTFSLLSGIRQDFPFS